MIQVKERMLFDVKTRFDSLATDLIKMEYLESVLKTHDIGIEVKKFAFGTLAELYEKRAMFENAAKSMFGKAGYDVTFREKIESYLKAGEFYARAGNIVSAEDMFLRAKREANSEQQPRIVLFRKNILLTIAGELEKKQRMSHATKFYEHLLSLKLDDLEKSLIKNKLVEYYKKVGRFNDARAVETK